MITPECRTSYAHVHEASATPSGDMKFSLCFMIPKSDVKGIEAINKAIEKAVEKGIADGKFTQAQRKSLRRPLRDGSAEHADGSRSAEFDGMLFFNASSKNKPGIVIQEEDGRVVPLMNEDDFYSGCWCRGDVNFFPYNTAGNRGIGVGLNNAMKTRDDDRLDGRQSADQAFAKYNIPAEAGGELK